MKIAMIPIALESKRVRNKNLLLVHGDLLVSYAIEICKEADIFDEIYINSEYNIFKKIANKYKVKFYHRLPSRGGSNCTMSNESLTCDRERCQVHDHFVYDFLENTQCDYLFMVHSTSPLLRPITIKTFVNKMIKNKFDSFFTVVEHKKESFYGKKPINFDGKKKNLTQNLSPIKSITWGITGWKREPFINNYEKGPTFNGKIGLFTITPIEALDVDTWEDLRIVESCLANKNEMFFYYNNNITKIDRNLSRLINQDGILNFYIDGANQLTTNLEEIKKKMGKPPWCYVLVYTNTDQCAYICQTPNEGCRTHAHITKDEWWYIVEGEFEWFLPVENRKIKVKEGETVFLKKGTIHKISCIGDKPGIRLAHGSRDMEHIYYE
jgi:CMP-N-acetylneuraminic acid synthetase/mannose-6-phosphate isomerase-like protein (cupin superfamily)